MLGTESAHPAQEWDFFIAYSSADRSFAEELYESLSSRSRVFLDTRCLLPGDNWDSELNRALRQSRITVVLISSHSSDSYYQGEEIVAAIDLARTSSTRRVVPVFLDSVPNDVVPYGLRRKQRLSLDSRGSSGVTSGLLDLLQKLDVGHSASSHAPLPPGIPKPARKWLRYGFVAAALLVLGFEMLYVPLIDFVVRGNPVPPDVAPHAFDAYRNTDHTLIAVALGIAAFLALLGYNRYAGIPIPNRQMDWLYCCWVAVALSICSGILGDFYLLQVESGGALTTETPRLEWPCDIQIFALLVAVPFAIVFGIAGFRQPKDAR